MRTLKILLGTIVISIALSTTAFAYLDPSVATYLIQAIAGIFIAVGAGFALYFHKIKKKVNKVLNIDENAKKEVEEDIVVFNEEDKKK